MFPKLSLLVAIPALLASTVLAAPAPAIAVPDALAPRETACPTVSRWQAYSYSTVWLSTTTVTNGWSSLGSVTSTKTESETRTINTISTVISPAVTTLPATTVSPIIATVTTTIVWQTYTTTVTSPGYAPASVCDVTTVTYVIPSTTSVTWTQDLLYAFPFLTLFAALLADRLPSYDTTWASTTGHVSTKTEVYLTTSTRTVTSPGATTYATTVSKPTTLTSVAITFSTITSTVWAQGCQTWACKL